MTKSRIVNARVTTFSFRGHGGWTSNEGDVHTDRPEGDRDAVLYLTAPERQNLGKRYARRVGKIIRAYCDARPLAFHVIDIPGESWPRIVKVKRP